MKKENKKLSNTFHKYSVDFVEKRNRNVTVSSFQLSCDLLSEIFAFGKFSFYEKEFVEAVMKLLSLEFEDYNDFVSKFGQSTSETPVNTAWLLVGSYYEAIGVLLKKNLIDVHVVYKLVPVSVVWEKMRPIAEGQRKETGPGTWEWFEYLYNEMKKRDTFIRTIQAQQ